MLSFPPPPVIDGLIFLRVQACAFRDSRGAFPKTEIFPVYLYKDPKDGKLVRMVEDRYSAYDQRLSDAGLFGSKGAR